jgi:ribosome-binding protein aMBF1 (putative translation factor)
MRGDQIRAAREIVGLSQPALAVMIQFGERAVVEFESGKPTLPKNTVDYLKRAFEASGVEFIRHGPGARLRSARL